MRIQMMMTLRDYQRLYYSLAGHLSNADRPTHKLATIDCRRTFLVHSPLSCKALEYFQA